LNSLCTTFVPPIFKEHRLAFNRRIHQSSFHLPPCSIWCSVPKLPA
jgi:hypothetical protein